MRREEDRSSILSGAGRGDPLNGRDKLSGGRAVFFRLCLKLTAAGSGKQNGRNNTRMNNVVTGQLQQQVGSTRRQHEEAENHTLRRSPTTPRVSGPQKMPHAVRFSSVLTLRFRICNDGYLRGWMPNELD
jgi:hypothetical protein